MNNDDSRISSSERSIVDVVHTKCCKKAVAAGGQAEEKWY